MEPRMTDALIARSALPHTMPAGPGARLALFVFRRLGAHGLDDAVAAQAMLTAFGQGFRRPLVLMRAMMADLAASAVAPIAIAPCCCVRMTHAEHAMLTVLTRAETAPDSARLLLADLLAVRHADGVFACVAAVATAFADTGRPITV
jgi:hypothetical protein